MTSDSTYVLGHADVEVQRLLLQGQLYNHHTEHALHVAGLRPGMRVLDMGCGRGDVSFVAARLVGPTGTVVGIDAAADIIELAQIRAAELDVPNVRFHRAAIEDIELDEPTPAIVSRARRHHAGWMPMAVPVVDMVPAQVSLLDGATDIPVSVIVPEAVEPALLDAYRSHGAERASFLLSTKPESDTLRLLDSIAALTEIYI